uniref:Uncharacterized protein n=1 Tax=Anguilla anguilla TaxID=7936 RepID=A0A0E9RJG7_ANGAN
MFLRFCRTDNKCKNTILAKAFYIGSTSLCTVRTSRCDCILRN